MPRFHAQPLREMISTALQKVAVPTDEADLTARLMVDANLCGHDTHGIRQIARYVGLIQDGTIKAGAEVTVEKETPVTALLDGHDQLGFVAATQATELAIKKAKETKLAAVAVRNLNHVGRVGAYPEMIANAGLIGLVTVNAQAMGILVAPFGGLTPRIGTNPFGAGFPNPKGPPVLLDFATSEVAANKIRQAHSRGKPAGDGWIMDRQGNPTNDPQRFLDGEAVMLPLGGGQGHKGYGLAVMVDILSGIVAGAGTALAPVEKLNNGTFIFCVDPEAFLTREEYDTEMAAYGDYLKASPPMPGGKPVELPGEYEANHRAQRQREGIDIEPPVWELITACITSLGLETPQAIG